MRAGQEEEREGSVVEIEASRGDPVALRGLVAGRRDGWIGYALGLRSTGGGPCLEPFGNCWLTFGF